MADGKVKIETELDDSGLNKDLSDVESKVSKTGSAFSGLGKVGATALKGAAVAVGAVSTAMVGVGAVAVKVGSEFESQMSRVQAISGATGEEFDQLRELALQLGSDTAFSASEAAQGMENLAAAGFTTTEVMDAMPGLLDLAAASGEDLAVSSDIAASAIQGFGLEAGDAAHVADVLAENANRTASSVADTGEAMKYVAPVAHAMGISIEETAAAIGIMANAGIQGSQAGTTLRGALSRITKPTQEMQTAMEELGISFYDSTGKMKPLSEQIELLETSMAGLTDEQKNQYLITLYGQESLSGMLALINAGSGELDALTQSFVNADGAAKQTAETMQDNFKGAVEQLQGSLETLGIVIYDGMSEPLKEVAQLATEAVNELTNAFQTGGIEGFATTLGSVLGDAIASMAQQAPKVVEIAVTIIQSFVQGLTANAPQILQGAIAIITTFANGIIQVLPQLATLGFTVVQQLYTTIVAAAPGILQAGYQLVMNLINGFVEAIPTVLPQILSFVQGIGDSLAAAAPILIQKGYEMISKLIEGFTTALPILISQVPQIITTFANIINDNFPVILQKGVELLLQLIQGIISAIPTLIANIPQIIQAIVSVIMAYDWLSLGSKIIQFFGNGIKSMINFVKTNAKNVYDTIIETLSKLPAKLLELGKNAFTALGNAISSLVGFIRSNATNIFNAVIDALKQLPSKLLELGKSAVSGLGNAISSGISTVVGAAKSIASGVVSAIQAIPGQVVSVGSNIVHGIWNGIAGAAGWLYNKVVGFASSIVSNIKGALGISSPSKVMRDEVGQWMAKGIWVGFDKNDPFKQIQRSLDVGVRGLQMSVFSGSAGTTNNQTNNFYGMQSPDQVARALRLQQIYGLAGAR